MRGAGYLDIGVFGATNVYLAEELSLNETGVRGRLTPALCPFMRKNGASMGTRVRAVAKTRLEMTLALT